MTPKSVFALLGVLAALTALAVLFGAVLAKAEETRDEYPEAEDTPLAGKRR